MWNAANMSFALCPMLTRGAIEALELRGSEQLKRTYLPKMVSGEWTGTMNLTEPQAGSDLAAVAHARRAAGDGTYRLVGQKIFITYGEHDLAENIIHLVLARTPDAPAGVKGISLFVVPKFLVERRRQRSARATTCAASPSSTSSASTPARPRVLAFGDKDGAIGYLVGRGEPRPRVHVHHDERRALRGRPGGRRRSAERAYQQRARLRAERIQGTRLRLARRARCRSSATPTCAAC